MNKEIINKVLEKSNKIADLKVVKEKINNINKDFRLSYISKNANTFSSDWQTVDIQLMNDIYDILDNHDKLIRQEIDEKINQLENELAEL